RPGRCPPVPAQGVGPRPAAAYRGGRAAPGPPLHPARIGPGDAGRTRPAAAACLDLRGRRTGPLYVVSPGIAVAGRVLFAGCAVEHVGAGPDGPRPAVWRSRGSAARTLDAGGSLVRRRCGDGVAD